MNAPTFLLVDMKHLHQNAVNHCVSILETSEVQKNEEGVGSFLSNLQLSSQSSLHNLVGTVKCTWAVPTALLDIFKWNMSMALPVSELRACGPGSAVHHL